MSEEQGRNADILQSIVDGTEYTAPPQSRIEDLLLQVKEVIEEGGGTKIRLADVSGAAVSMTNTTATLTWTDPEDIVVSGSVLAKWAGTKVLRKIGSAPESITDGVVVVDSKIKNQYSANGYEDTGLEYNTMYYYRWFPYTEEGVVTDGSAVSVTPARTKITTIPSQSGTLTYNGNEQTAVWSNYDPDKMTVTGDTGTNAGTYTASFMPKEGYCWDDDSTTAKAVQWTIGKATGTVTLSESAIVLDDNTTYADITITAVGGGTLSVESSATAVATVGDIVNNIFRVTAGDWGTATVTVSMTATANYTAASATVGVAVKRVEIVTWADGTDEQVATMIDAANAGDITLSDYWSVGDTRSVNISSFSGNNTPTHVAQTVELTLVQAGLYKDTNNKGVNFIIGLKNVLANGTTREGEYINSTNTNAGSWRDTAMRTLCNGNFFNALPEWLRTRIKTVKVVTGDYNGTTEGGANIETNDKVFLPAEKEVQGSKTWSTDNEAGALTQFTYYTTAANRIKKAGASGSAISWWLRSPRYNNSNCFCMVSSFGLANEYTASAGSGLAPHFCI